jgi:hypothetical protein
MQVEMIHNDADAVHTEFVNAKEVVTRIFDETSHCMTAFE